MKCKVIRYVIITFMFVLSTIYLFTIPVQAATVVIPPIEPPLPVGLPDFTDYNTYLDVSMIERVRTMYINLLSSQYNNDVSENYIIMLTHSPNSSVFTFTCFNIPEMAYATYTDRPNEVIYYNMGQHYVLYIYDASNQSWIDNNFSGGWVNNFTVRYEDLMSFGNGWVVDMAYDELYTRSGQLFWSKDVEITQIGVTPLPSVPDLDNPEIDNPSSPTLPSQPPYDPTISVGENIGNWFSWLGSLIAALFNNLINNIKNFFSNLFNNLKSWLQGIKDEIRNGFQNLVNNLTSLFKPFFDNITSLIDRIREKINYFTEIPTISDIIDIFDNSTTFSIISGFTSNVTSFVSSFASVQEPETFTIPIHLENIDTSLLPTLQTFYIDLGVINSVKSLLRAFVTAFITYGLVITIIHSLGNLLKGGS